MMPLVRYGTNVQLQDKMTFASQTWHNSAEAKVGMLVLPTV